MYSNLRIGGLATGMDIDQLVSDLMKAERMKVDKLGQEKQVLEWQQEDYRSINSTLRSFRDNNIFKMKLSSTYQAHKASSTNESMVTVSANSTAMEGTHTIKVDQLARGASITSGSAMGSTDKLATLNSQLGANGVLDFVVNDVDFKIDAATESIYDLVNKINKHTTAGVSLNITTKASETQAQVQTIRLADSALTEGLTFTIGDKKIALWNSDNSTYETKEAAESALGADYLYDISPGNYDQAHKIIDHVLTQVAPTGAGWAKGAEDTGANGYCELTITSSEPGVDKAVTTQVSGGKSWDVRASYDATVDRFFLSTNKTGEDQHLKITDNTISQLLRLTDNTGDIDTAYLVDFPDGNDGPKVFKGSVVSDGRNAKVNIDDIEITNYKSNQFTLNGVTYNLQNADPAVTTTVKVQNDTEGVFNSITSFVDEYNKIIDTIDKKLSEKRYKDYTWPLSDTQKEKLTDQQIDQWKERARSGMLRNDNTLRDIRDKLRLTVAGLSKIGITTTKDYMSSKLEISENGEKQLRDAIQNDLQGVIDLFTKDSENDSEKGIARKLSDHVSNTINTIIDKAGANGNKTNDDSFIGKRLTNVGKDIDGWEDRLTQIEDRYWKRFSAMETAINQLNQQSSWLTQQLGGS